MLTPCRSARFFKCKHKPRIFSFFFLCRLNPLNSRNMPCHINNCQITDASHLMQCSGSCGRSYHAACAGTQRNYENEITNYMIPLCRDCQGVISVEVTTRAVLLQQQKLTCDIKALIDANFKACNAFKQMDNKIEVVQDEYEGIATLLGDMQQQLNRRMQKSFVNFR